MGSDELKADGMDFDAAMAAFAAQRSSDQIVVTNQTSARRWPLFSDQVLDLNYNPSAMGVAVPLALGIALARPEKEVIVFTGDGALLMNLGSLATVVDSSATNLTVIVMDNGVYEVTGRQKIPLAGHRADYSGIARTLGFASVNQFVDIASWQAYCSRALAVPGPRCIALRVRPGPHTSPAIRPRTLLQEAADLSEHLRQNGAS